MTDSSEARLDEVRERAQTHVAFLQRAGREGPPLNDALARVVSQYSEDVSFLLAEMERKDKALRAVVYDSDMKHNRWGLWHKCKEALEAELGGEVRE